MRNRNASVAFLALSMVSIVLAFIAEIRCLVHLTPGASPCEPSSMISSLGYMRYGGIVAATFFILMAAVTCPPDGNASSRSDRSTRSGRSKLPRASVVSR